MKINQIFSSKENLKCGLFGAKIVSMVGTHNIFWNGLKISQSAQLVVVTVGVISSKQIDDDIFYSY